MFHYIYVTTVHAEGAKPSTTDVTETLVPGKSGEPLGWENSAALGRWNVRTGPQPGQIWCGTRMPKNLPPGLGSD